MIPQEEAVGEEEDAAEAADVAEAEARSTSSAMTVASWDITRQSAAVPARNVENKTVTREITKRGPVRHIKLKEETPQKQRHSPLLFLKNSSKH